MILSYDDIRAQTVCPDCARREVEVTTYPHLTEALAALGVCPDAALQAAEVVLDEYGQDPGPINTVQVHHDDGCPRLRDIIEVPEGAHLIEVHPVDLPDDHPWVIATQNAPK